MSTQPLQAAQQTAAQVLANVTSDQLGNSTPCAKWDVAALIDHLVGSQHWGRSAMQGVEMTDTGEGSAAGRLQRHVCRSRCGLPRFVQRGRRVGKDRQSRLWATCLHRHCSA
jgi:hypothetical protein